MFPNVYVFALESKKFGPHQTTNIILVGSKDSHRLIASEWSQRAAEYQSESYVKTPEMQAIVGDLIEAAVDPAVPIFTDDYAPIEMMAF